MIKPISLGLGCKLVAVIKAGNLPTQPIRGVHRFDGNGVLPEIIQENHLKPSQYSHFNGSR